MHSFIHPLQAAVPPCWESRSDWDIFKAIAEKVSELAQDAPARAGAGDRHPPAPARHPRRDGPAGASRLGGRASASRCPGRPCPACPTSTATTSTSTGSSSPSARWCARRASAPTASPGRWTTSTTSSSAIVPDRGVGRRTLPVHREREGRRQRHPAPRPGDQRRIGLPRLRRRGEEGRAAAHRPRGREPERPDHLRRPGPPAAAAPRQPLLDRHHRQRPHLLGLLPQRGAARPLADAHRAAALLPRPPGVHRLRRGAPHLQAEAGAGRRPRPGGLRGRPARACSSTT